MVYLRPSFSTTAVYFFPGLSDLPNDKSFAISNRMTTFLPAEKGMTIRQPSTANLMLDSADRNKTRNPLANSFSINRSQSILNGFFTRIGTTEVVFEYKTANISADLSNNSVSYDLSGVVSGTLSGSFTISEGNYSVSDALTAIAEKLTDISGTWTATEYQGGAVIAPAANVYISLGGALAESLGIETTLLLVGPTGAGTLPGLYCEDNLADLRPYRYLDFVSQQLTYNQDLKDGSTSIVNRDVLCRWYMAYDEAPQLDALGFPILMGYKPFTLRRLFNPPKQIRWDNIQPVGNISFQVFTDQNVLAPFSNNTEWLMTLQVSEC